MLASEIQSHNKDILDKYNQLLNDNNLDPELFCLNIRASKIEDDFANNKVTLFVEAIPVNCYRALVTKIDNA